MRIIQTTVFRPKTLMTEVCCENSRNHIVMEFMKNVVSMRTRTRGKNVKNNTACTVGQRETAMVYLNLM